MRRALHLLRDPRMACIGALLAAAPPALGAPAQFDPTAPEPIVPLCGAIVLAGDGEPGPEVLEHFLARAPVGAPVLVLGAGAGARDLCARLGPRARQLEPGAPLAADLARDVRGAGGVWLAGDGEWDALLVPGGPLAQALADLVRGGGAAGAAGPLARRLDAGGTGLLAGFGLAGADEDPAPRLAERPGVPVVRLPPGTALEVCGRELALLGTGGEVLLAGGDAGRLHGVWIERGRRLDRIALARAAVARAAPPAEPGTPAVPSGALFLAGGGALPPGALERFIELAGGPEVPLLVIPCADELALAHEPPMVRALRAAGARDVAWIHAQGRGAADADAEVLEPLRRARGVWLGSGRPHRLLDLYENTEVHRLLHAVLARGGAVGGSSAGASVLASTLARGGPLSNRDVLAAGYERGFGLLCGAAVDQHFRERARFPELLALKRARPELLGIGIDEGTVLVVRGTVGEVLGLGEVAFFDTPAAPVSPEGAATRAAAGGRYDLVLRRPL